MPIHANYTYANVWTKCMEVVILVKPTNFHGKTAVDIGRQRNMTWHFCISFQINGCPNFYHFFLEIVHATNFVVSSILLRFIRVSHKNIWRTKITICNLL